MISARSCDGGTRSVSTSSSAYASTNAWPPDSWATSATNWPGPGRHGNDVPTVALIDRDDSLQHDKHSWCRLARHEEPSAARVALHGAEAADARDVRLRQHRKHLMPAASDRGRNIVRNGHFHATAPVASTRASLKTAPDILAPIARSGCASEMSRVTFGGRCRMPREAPG